jgi:hypothetical protein
LASSPPRASSWVISFQCRRSLHSNESRHLPPAPPQCVESSPVPPLQRRPATQPVVARPLQAVVPAARPGNQDRLLWFGGPRPSCKSTVGKMHENEWNEHIPTRAQ